MKGKATAGGDHYDTAAPDLLDALIDILGSLNVASRNPNIPDDTIVPVDMTMGEIRKGLAAILRATGEGENRHDSR
jgi:hypothetical protein